MVILTKPQQRVLFEFLKTPRTVPQIAFEMDWAYPTASQKLKVLEAGGVLIAQKNKNGEKIYYKQQG